MVHLRSILYRGPVTTWLPWTGKYKVGDFMDRLFDSSCVVQGNGIEGKEESCWMIRFYTCTFMEDIPCLPRTQSA
ncbi:hypothetical protein HZ326_14948 [Fusarium oxysporum f. sp. albedinis]|nr:hypothetical protein HZ326_14948 [Fusarium oxysporum f. sp. albedinis]